MRRGGPALVALCSLSSAIGCRDVQQPAVPVEGPEAADLGVISCRANVDAGTVECAQPAMGRSSLRPMFDIVGGQGVHILLSSSNVHYDAATEVFYADVTVQNLMSSTLGTPDGSSVTGMRVFFHSGPTVTSGSGTVSVRNPDGTATFTGASQPYHEYAEMLETGETTAPKTWEWDVPSSVVTFAFQVYVEADRAALAPWWIGSRAAAGQRVPGLGWTVAVDAAAQSITEITHYMGGTDHVLGNVTYTCGPGASFVAISTETNGVAGWPINANGFDTGFETVLGGVGSSYWLDIDLEGDFQSQALTGSWRVMLSIVNRIPPTTNCSGSWSGEPATRLFLRYDGTAPFLAEAPSPAGESWLVSFADGQTVAWSAELDDPLMGDLYALELPLRAASGSGGGFTIVLKVDHGATEIVLAQATVNVPRSDSFYYFGRMIWWSVEGGSAGDQLIVQITYSGSAPGELLFGYGHESYTVLSDRIDVSTTSSPTALLAAGGRRIEPSPVHVGGRLERPER